MDDGPSREEHKEYGGKPRRDQERQREVDQDDENEGGSRRSRGRFNGDLCCRRVVSELPN